jgi:hypothetical protein
LLGGREEGRKGGREGGRKEGREGGREGRKEGKEGEVGGKEGVKEGEAKRKQRWVREKNHTREGKDEEGRSPGDPPFSFHRAKEEVDPAEARSISWSMASRSMEVEERTPWMGGESESLLGLV